MPADWLLHHFFILTAPGADIAERLIEAGLIEGPANNHPGQGTANRRFFLANTTLELLYISDEAESKSGPARHLRFSERAGSDTACPFGLVLQATKAGVEPPFIGWNYCPQYFEDDQCFLVGENSDQLDEPLCICLPQNLPLPQSAYRNDNPELSLTRLKLSLPVGQTSSVMASLSKISPITFNLKQPQLLEVELNNAVSGNSLSLLPDLELILKW